MIHSVTFLPHNRVVRVAGGTTILDAANWAGVSIESICGGRGTCGKCQVKLLNGAAPGSEGWCLACRAAIHADCRVEVPPIENEPVLLPPLSRRPIPLAPNVHKIQLRLAEPSLEDPRSDCQRVTDALRERGRAVKIVPAVWRRLPQILRAGSFAFTAVVCGDELIAAEPANPSLRSLGLAIDVGTTTIGGAIVDLTTGATLSTGSIRNSQAAHGADVIERISYASIHENGLAVLSRNVRDAINQLIGKLLVSCDAPRENVYEAIVVGNPAMLHLLLGVPPDAIGVAPFIPVFEGPVALPAAGIGLRLHPQARLSTLPQIGAYVGADAVAGILATHLIRQDDGKRRLFLDIGTNIEIIISAAGRSVCTAAPAGPAFEGSHIQCGMRATEGAIQGVRIAGDVQLDIIGNEPQPAGICGSGLVSAVAALLACGLLDSSGRLASRETVRAESPPTLVERLVRRCGQQAFLLSCAKAEILLTQNDIRALQYAKAATMSGASLLLAHLGIEPDDLDEVLLAGAFGSSLDPASARAIGLVPWIPLERIRAVGNAALAGAQIALLSYPERQAARQIPTHLEYLELSAHPRFNDCFLEALPFPDPG